MSFWSKLGKIGLAAAPYVAAPFTGGASLAFAPAANAAVQKWNQHDAANNAAKGIGPSKFDSVLGGVSNYAGMASGMTNGFGMGGDNGYGNQGGQSNTGMIGKLGALTTNTINSLPSGGGGMQGQPSNQGTGYRQGINPSADPNKLSGSKHADTSNPMYQQMHPSNQGIGPSYQYPNGQGYQGQNYQPAPGGYQGYQGQNDSGGGYNPTNPANWAPYTGEDVGHNGKTAEGMTREQYRDAWMSSGISNPQQMQQWLSQHGGQMLNASGVVRTPFGETLDMGTAFKTGAGSAGWTDIGMNNQSAYQGWNPNTYNPDASQRGLGPSQQPAAPQQPEAPEPSYEDFVRDYWAPDRDAVLAARAPQNQPPPPPANPTLARKIGRGGQYVNA